VQRRALRDCITSPTTTPPLPLFCVFINFFPIPLRRGKYQFKRQVFGSLILGGNNEPGWD